MMLVPDSPLAERVVPSPNHGPRRGGGLPEGERRPDSIVLHYTGMGTATAALHWLCNPQSQVSCHYFVFEDGRVLQLVPETRRAWHAGKSCWQGESDMNSASIGIEIAHPGHEGGNPPFPDPQIAAVIDLVSDVVQRWRMVPERLLAHSDVAPTRKADPGENFPWRALAGAGLGHWVEPASIEDGRFFSRGEQGSPIEALQALFALYGYDIALDGQFGPQTEAVVRAFQRHFRQERTDGIADVSTIRTLRTLLASRPGQGAGDA